MKFQDRLVAFLFLVCFSFMAIACADETAAYKPCADGFEMNKQGECVKESGNPGKGDDITCGDSFDLSVITMALGVNRIPIDVETIRASYPDGSVFDGEIEANAPVGTYKFYGLSYCETYSFSASEPCYQPIEARPWQATSDLLYLNLDPLANCGINPELWTIFNECLTASPVATCCTSFPQPELDNICGRTQ